MPQPFLTDIALRFANLRRPTILKAGFMSGIVSVILSLACWLLDSSLFSTWDIPLVFALWTIDDMGYRLRQHPGVYVLVAGAGGLFGTTMNALMA